jgi:hypothetical protein
MCCRESEEMTEFSTRGGSILLVIRQVRADLERPIYLTINALAVCLHMPSTCNIMRIERIHVEKSVRCRKRKKEKDGLMRGKISDRKGHGER